MNQPDLQEMRKRLDQLDARIVELFEERMAICSDVAEYKIITGKSVYDRERERQKIEKVQAMTHTPENRIGAGELFSQIMTISRRLQYQLLTKHGKGAGSEFQCIPKLNTEDVHIIYQGTQGAYAHEAALKFFGPDARVSHVRTWEEVMQAVECGQADYGVLPIENSSAGAVIDNYDLLLKYHNYIVGETCLAVDHALLSIPEASIESVRRVYSHPQALMQCSEFLHTHPQWTQIPVENTACAAKKMQMDQDPSQAAIASETAGRIYGLKTLKPSINHNKHNTTRFMILSSQPVYCEDAGKISLCFELPHQSGSLYNMLGNFIYNGVNMLMIQSRPVLEHTWEYRFFVDIEGRLDDPGVRNALMGIKAEASYMRILGNY